MKKFKIAPSANVLTAATLKSKFERLSLSIGDNGLTPSFKYVIIQGAYNVKSGINPQTKQAVEYPTVRAVKIGEKSGKIGGISELSINSLKRTVNIDDSSIEVIDFSTIIPNCSELNALQLLETLSEDKCFAIIPNGTVLANTNFDANIRPRQLYKCIEISDAATVTAVVKAAKDAGLTE